MTEHINYLKVVVGWGVAVLLCTVTFLFFARLDIVVDLLISLGCITLSAILYYFGKAMKLTREAYDVPHRCASSQGMQMRQIKKEEKLMSRERVVASDRAATLFWFQLFGGMFLIPPLVSLLSLFCGVSLVTLFISLSVGLLVMASSPYWIIRSVRQQEKMQRRLKGLPRLADAGERNGSMTIRWCSMRKMQELANLPMPKFQLLQNNRLRIVGSFCSAYINHRTNELSLNIINRFMPHPQIELFFTYFHEALHILNYHLLHRQVINRWIDWFEQRILQRTIYQLWRRSGDKK